MKLSKYTVLLFLFIVFVILTNVAQLLSMLNKMFDSGIDRWYEGNLDSVSRKYSRNNHDNGSNLQKNETVHYDLKLKDTMRGKQYASISQYLQPSSIRNMTADSIMKHAPMQFIPTLRNPCFYVEAGEKDVRVTETLTVLCLPFVFLCGVEKCGTTDLYTRLSLHQHVEQSHVKETHWFNNEESRRQYHHGTLAGFNTLYKEGLQRMATNCSQQINPYNIWSRYFTQNRCEHILIDGTPRYFQSFATIFDPQNRGYPDPKVLIPHRIAHLLPNPKLLIMLRNPVDRIFSAYRYFKYSLSLRNRPPSLEDFHQSVLNGTESWHFCVSLTSETNCAFHMNVPEELLKKHFYDFRAMEQIRIGLYHIILREWLMVFHKENFLLIKTEDYTTNPKMYVENAVLPFLGLKPYDMDSQTLLETYSQSNTIFNKATDNLTEMLPETKRLLEEFYKPHNVKLSYLLKDRRFLWDMH